MKKEFRIFCTALMFYTRFPCKVKLNFSDEMLRNSVRYFPLIGLITGGLTASVFYAAVSFLTAETAVLLSVGTGIVFTGAFHEDGLADTADGLGGGWNKEQILEIMKDSRIGTYGVIALLGVLALKFYALSDILPSSGYRTGFLILAGGHAVSRWTAVVTMLELPYVREDALSKVKPVVRNGVKAKSKNFVAASIFALLPLVFYLPLLFLLVPVFVVQRLLSRLYRQKIGGYTGDTLGAMQQITEITFYLSALSLWKFM